MDKSKIFIKDETVEKTVFWNGDEYKFVVRPISWLAEGEITNKALSIEVRGKKGGVKPKFDQTIYNLEYMKKIIVEPVFTTTEWLTLNPDFAQAMVDTLIDGENEVNTKN